LLLRITVVRHRTLLSLRPKERRWHAVQAAFRRRPAIHMPIAAERARIRLARLSMIEDILAPGRVLESLMRRAARGHRPSLRTLMELTPAICAAEDRFLYPELLKAGGTGAQRAWLLPFASEHEQMHQLVEQLGRASPAPKRDDPMFRALQWLVARHTRAEREWLQEAVTRQPLPDVGRLDRFVEQTRPLVDRALQTMAGGRTGERDDPGGRARIGGLQASYGG
jgi:hypothetical protein